MEASDHQYDYKKFAVLFVASGPTSVAEFGRQFGGIFRVITAANLDAGLQLLQAQKEEVGLIIAEQQLSGESGVRFLGRARDICPRVGRILVSEDSDAETLIEAVNSGAILKFVRKPWDPKQLEAVIRRGLELFVVENARDQLLREKLAALHSLMIRDRIVSLGLLAAGMSHHIRNALVAVKTFLDLTPAKLREENLDLDSLRNPDFWNEYYVHVQGQLEKINSMLKDLWSVSGTPHFEFNERVRPHALLGEVLEKMRSSFAAKNLTVENRVPDSLPKLIADEAKLSRLFELLLKDEIVSLPFGSRVTITGRMGTSPMTQQALVEIELHDNGPGLPEEALRMIFDPFVTRSASPVEYGVNLMASYLIAHHHGGSIQAQSEEGKGTTFTLRLPIDPNRPVSIEQNGDFLGKVLANESLWNRLLQAP